MHKTLVIRNHSAPFLSGFISGDSTTHQLLYINLMFCKAVDDQKEVRVVFCDISKALDRVWHSGFLFKQAAIRGLGKLLLWFTLLSLDVHKGVVVIGRVSDWATFFAVVPLRK